MDHRFTERIGRWLDTPASDRDLEEGALLLLKLTGNKLLYANLLRNLPAQGEYLEHHLRKYYTFRVQDLTHEQVAELTEQAEKAVARHIPDADSPAGAPPTDTAGKAASARGIRPDHDSLPPEIQACWVENLALLRRMREVHLRLRGLSLENAPCPDSDRYPYVRELVDLDKTMLANYARYDSYGRP